jgi:uncharacterized membrane protein YbaN (DUF454 family)
MNNYFKVFIQASIVIGIIFLAMLAVGILMPMSPMVPFPFKAEYEKIK